MLSIEKEMDPVIISRIPDATKQCQERFSDVSDEPFVVQSRITACIYDLAVTGDNSVSLFEFISSKKQFQIFFIILYFISFF